MQPQPTGLLPHRLGHWPVSRGSESVEKQRLLGFAQFAQLIQQNRHMNFWIRTQDFGEHLAI